jgi:hypothetical protein
MTISETEDQRMQVAHGDGMFGFVLEVKIMIIEAIGAYFECFQQCAMFQQLVKEMP